MNTLKARCCTTVSVHCVECACVEDIPECIALGKMSGEHYLRNKVTAHGPVAEISAPVQNDFFAAK